MRIAAKILILAMLGSTPAAIAQELSPVQEAQIRYELLLSLYRTSPDTWGQDQLEAEIVSLRQQMRAIATEDDRANGRAWLNINLRLHRSEVALMLMAAEPPRWQIWYWRRRVRIERLIRALKAMDRDGVDQ